MASPGEFDYWLAGELPETPPDGKGTGEFDYWSGGELPPGYGAEAAGVISPTKAVVLREAVNTSTGIQSFTTMDLRGQEPKAVIVILSRTLTNETETPGVGMSVGYATDDSHQYVTSYGSEDNVTTSEAYRCQSDGEVAHLIDGNGNDLAIGEFHDMVLNGFQIDWTTAPAGAYLMTAILFAGTEVSAQAGDFAVNIVEDAYTDETLTFNADLIFTMYAKGTADGSLADAYNSLGVAVEGSPISNLAVLHRQENGQHKTDNRVGLADERCIIDQNIGIEITDINATGFRATTRDDTPDGAEIVFYLALAFGDVNVWAGFENPAEYIGVKDYTTPAFQPQLWMWVLNFGDAMDTSWDAGASNAGTLGVSAVDADNENCVHTKDEGRESISDCHTASTAQAIRVSSPFPADGRYVADFDSFLATGLRLDFTEALGAGEAPP